MSAQTIGALWRAASRLIDRNDARHLLTHVSGCSYAHLLAFPEFEPPQGAIEQFESLVGRRARGEPLAYLLGSAWFCGLEFSVSPAVLIPRPETETLVTRGVFYARQMKRPRILDAGTGSGIVAVMLSKRCPQAEVFASDISPDALCMARLNAARHGAAVRFVQSDWFSAFDEPFDLILSNPPYVARDDPHLLENGLPHEPRLALTDDVAGDGLACIRHIVARSVSFLRPGGRLLVEHGYDQAARVKTLFVQAGFLDVATTDDDAGIPRVSEGRLALHSGN